MTNLVKKLHLHLLGRVAKNKCTIEIPDNFFINNHQYSLYDISQVYVESKKRESLIENEHPSSWQEIVAEMMKEYQVSLDKIKFVYEDHDKMRNKSLVDIARIDLSYENEQYMLVDGYRCEFNQVYLEFVNEEVDKINYKLNEFLYKEDIQTLKGTDLPEKYSYNNVELNGLEDRIIAYYAQDSNYKPFHHKLIKPVKDGTPFGNGNELCDLAFKVQDETYLVSTKVSMGTDPFLKCIDQSLYSLNILRNPDSFEINGIGDYLNPDYVALHIILRKNDISYKTKKLKNDSHIEKVEKG